MTRWRLTVWLIPKPEVRVKKHWRGSCKLCAIDRCMMLAQECAAAHKMIYAEMGWKVERLAGVVDGWSIVYTSDMPKLARVKRHAH